MLEVHKSTLYFFSLKQHLYGKSIQKQKFYYWTDRIAFATMKSYCNEKSWVRQRKYSEQAQIFELKFAFLSLVLTTIQHNLKQKK